MRKQLVKSVESILEHDDKTVLMLGDIGVFGFRHAFNNYPSRVYNIGILEQSTVSLSAGLALTGLIPIVHTIAPFLIERALEQLKVDFGYQNLGGNFVSVGYSYDYAGLGATHHCPGDVAQLLTIPNMEITLPGTSLELDSLLRQAYDNKNPTYFRLSEYENEVSYDVKLGKANLIKEGKDATIICVGNMLENVLRGSKNLDVTILYYTSIHPFDSKLLLENFNENIIVVEPYYMGAVNYKITQSLKGKKYNITNIGVPHNFLTNYGTKKEHDKNMCLDEEGIEKTLKKCLS